MPNRSLDDFARGDDEEETEADASDAEPEEPDAETDTAESAPEPTETGDESDAETDAETGDESDAEAEPTLTVEEATPTYDFSPDGSTCESCGETVDTRWHDPDAGMVCAECKGWE